MPTHVTCNFKGNVPLWYSIACCPIFWGLATKSEIFLNTVTTLVKGHMIWMSDLSNLFTKNMLSFTNLFEDCDSQLFGVTSERWRTLAITLRSVGLESYWSELYLRYHTNIRLVTLIETLENFSHDGRQRGSNPRASRSQRARGMVLHADLKSSLPHADRHYRFHHKGWVLLDHKVWDNTSQFTTPVVLF